MLSYVLYGLSGALIAFGIYMLMLYVSAMPTQKSETVVAEVNKLDNVQSQTLINKLLGGISKLFLPLVELSDSTKYQIQAALSYFNYNVTPEQHFCDALTSGIVVAILCLPFMAIKPWAGLIGLILGAFIFKNEFNGPIKRMKMVREDIEYDAALFCKFISDALKEENRNVIDILTSCKESVSTSFKNELEHTLTDMKTGNQEQALVDMSRRISTSTMTQITVGLLGIVRGDNQTLYFEMLYEKLHKAELTRIRKQNSLKPGKISKISMLLILAVVGLILTGMILTLMEEFKSNGVL